MKFFKNLHLIFYYSTALSIKKLNGYSIFIFFPLYLVEVLHNSNMTNFSN